VEFPDPNGDDQNTGRRKRLFRDCLSAWASADQRVAPQVGGGGEISGIITRKMDYN
jgi:hypothetical protein